MGGIAVTALRAPGRGLGWLATLGLVAALSCQPPPAPSTPPATTPVESPVVAATTAPADAPAPAPVETLDDKAQRLAHELIILDGHVDLPWRLDKIIQRDGALTVDVSDAAPDGNFDVPRARAGGLDAPFMSIFVSADFEKKGAKKVADRLIDLVEGLAADHPEALALATSVADVRANFAAGKISLPMGMENGAPIERKLANVAYFHGRGIRYITLAHGKDNHISDSSYDTRHTHHGLSRFGRKVVAEMNRVGIMVDVSHLSDEAFDDVLAVSQVPVIASHSSCRHFTPGFQRNMSDEMIERLAAAGGVVQINFGSGFLDADVRAASESWEDAPEDHKPVEAPPRATVEDVADHIEHVIDLVGVEHVGLGSDFDGVGDSLPDGLRDVADYPNLLRVLLERGHDEDELAKICAENVLRVWQAVEDHAAAAP
jgi:membrane dipeptidase